VLSTTLVKNCCIFFLCMFCIVCNTLILYLAQCIHIYIVFWFIDYFIIDQSCIFLKRISDPPKWKKNLFYFFILGIRWRYTSPRGEITELAGMPGVGKTRMCMQLAINVQLPAKIGGVQGEVCYFVSAINSFFCITLPLLIFKALNMI
jgi:hypothetical protein